MYRALAFKELRETAWIGGLVLGALLLVVLDQMGRLTLILPVRVEPYPAHKIPFVYPGFNDALAVIAAAAAVALGFLQTLGESIRRTWLFLLHRPASRSTLILTKIAAGILLLLTATGLPVLIFAIWSAMPGHHASPFLWAMTWQSSRLCFGATALYFAACLCGLRSARWHGSRLLPLIPGAIVMAWVYVTVWWPFAGWIVVLVADAVYLAAILETARSREFS